MMGNKTEKDKQMKTPGLPEVMKHELCGLTVASMLGNFSIISPKSSSCPFQGNGSPRPQRLICWESWLRLLPTMTPPHVRPEPSRYRWWWWLMWWLCWYTGSWHTVDTPLVHSWYTGSWLVRCTSSESRWLRIFAHKWQNVEKKQVLEKKTN